LSLQLWLLLLILPNRLWFTMLAYMIRVLLIYLLWIWVLKVMTSHYFVSLIIQHKFNCGSFSLLLVFSNIKLILTGFINCWTFSHRNNLPAHHILVRWCYKLRICSLSHIWIIPLDNILSINLLNNLILLLGRAWHSSTVFPISPYSISSHLLISKMFN